MRFFIFVSFAFPSVAFINIERRKARGEEPAGHDPPEEGDEVENEKGLVGDFFDEHTLFFFFFPRRAKSRESRELI